MEPEAPPHHHRSRGVVRTMYVVLYTQTHTACLHIMSVFPETKKYLTDIRFVIKILDWFPMRFCPSSLNILKHIRSYGTSFKQHENKLKAKNLLENVENLLRFKIEQMDNNMNMTNP